MVKLTADVISESAQHVNACRERELDLRGYKFAMIENLGATMNQYDRKADQMLTPYYVYYYNYIII